MFDSFQKVQRKLKDAEGAEQADCKGTKEQERREAACGASTPPFHSPQARLVKVKGPARAGQNPQRLCNGPGMLVSFSFLKRLVAIGNHTSWPVN